MRFFYILLALALLAGCDEIPGPGSSGDGDDVQVVMALGDFGCICWVKEGELTCRSDYTCADYEIYPAPGGNDWEKVFVAYRHACAIDVDGGVFCWGKEDENAACVWGACDPPDEQFVNLVLNLNNTCGETIDHEVLCWGQGS